MLKLKTLEVFVACLLNGLPQTVLLLLCEPLEIFVLLANYFPSTLRQQEKNIGELTPQGKTD